MSVYSNMQDPQSSEELTVTQLIQQLQNHPGDAIVVGGNPESIRRCAREEPRYFGSIEKIEETFVQGAMLEEVQQQLEDNTVRKAVLLQFRFR